MYKNLKILRSISNKIIVILLLISIGMLSEAMSGNGHLKTVLQLQTKNSNTDSIKVVVPNKDKDSFYVKLKDTLRVEPSVYDSVSRIIAISDIEGNFNGLYSFLISNNVMDENYNWTFGDGHVVFLGDFVDRGNASVQVLWLIYKLEAEAAMRGGKVHYILGNHEVMDIQGVGYSEKRYNDDGESITDVPFDKSNKILFSTDSELGRWLRTKNSIEKIGNYTFVHGGISPKILSFKPNFDTINNTIRKNIQYDLYHKPGKNRFANFLLGREGPLWFRGLAMDYKYYDKVTPSQFKKIQAYFNCYTIVIGHTPSQEIRTDFDGSLIKIDTPHGQEKFSGATDGLLIENNVEFNVDDKGNKTKLL
jgi:hypothetical protein